jgi:superfamily II DNA or RNA helicase
MPKSYFSQFGAVFIDEAHLAKAKSLTNIMTKMQDCKYRIGTTGTLDGTEVHQLVLEGLFAKCKRVTTTSKLIEQQHLSDLHINCLVFNHPKEKRTQRTYDNELSFISLDEARNNFISKLALHEAGNTLVLCRYIAQLDILYENLFPTSRVVYKVYGKTPTEDREEVRNLVEQGENVIVVASYGVFSTGINIKRLHNIIFASPYKSQIRVLQSIGRGLRIAADKEQLKVFDIVDDLSYNNKENYTLKHFGDRINIYNEQGFDYDIIPISLKR